MAFEVRNSDGYATDITAVLFRGTRRNFLLLIHMEWCIPTVNVVALRESANDSLFFKVSFDTKKPMSSDLPAVVGWENAANSNSPGPRIANLGPMMDPTR